MAEREELIDAIVEEVQREVRRSIGERASTTDILRDVLRRRLSPPAEAQEVERLRAENERLREALKPVTREKCAWLGSGIACEGEFECMYCAARRALTQEARNGR